MRSVHTVIFRQGWFLSLVAVLAWSACSKPAGQASGGSGAPSTASSSPARRLPAPAVSAPPGETGPKTVLALPSSAYHASIEADEEGFVLLTATAAHRFVPGKPPTETPLDLAYGATTTRDSVLFWSGGEIRAVPKGGSTPRRLGRLPARPQRFVSSGDDFAWLEKTGDRFTVFTLNDGKPKLAYAAEGAIEALTMLSDWVFFVERLADGAWRIGGVKSSGGTPTFGEQHRGRTPAMLVGFHDLYYYDGTPREVRRLSPSLRTEETLAKDFICSPLAVWEHVYCARVEGLFEIRAGAKPRRLVESNLGTPITDLAVNARHIAFVSDVGADKLEVKVLPR